MTDVWGDSKSYTEWKQEQQTQLRMAKRRRNRGWWNTSYVSDQEKSTITEHGMMWSVVGNDPDLRVERQAEELKRELLALKIEAENEANAELLKEEAEIRKKRAEAAKKRELEEARELIRAAENGELTDEQKEDAEDDDDAFALFDEPKTVAQRVAIARQIVSQAEEAEKAEKEREAKEAKKKAREERQKQGNFGGDEDDDDEDEEEDDEDDDDGIQRMINFQKFGIIRPNESEESEEEPVVIRYCKTTRSTNVVKVLTEMLQRIRKLEVRDFFFKMYF